MVARQREPAAASALSLQGADLADTQEQSRRYVLGSTSCSLDFASSEYITAPPAHLVLKRSMKAAWTRSRSANTVRSMFDEERVTNAETLLASFFAKYEPAMVKLGKALRAKLRARLPGLFEIVYVYDSQNALVISYSPTERGSDGLCAIGLYPRCVKLFFMQGPLLSKSDPNKLLQGRGKTVRHVVLNAVADFDRAEIEVLMAAALKRAKLRLAAGAKGPVIIKAAAQKQRARRAAQAARPASTRRTAKARR